MPISAARVRGRFTSASPAEISAAVVVVLVLAAFAGPKLLQLSEQAKARAAFAYLSAVRQAEEHYAESHSVYTADLSRLRLKAAFPQGFTAGPIEAGETGRIQDSWSLTLTRPKAALGYNDRGPWPIRYGSYDIIFNENGWDDGSTIPPHLNPAGAP